MLTFSVRLSPKLVLSLVRHLIDYYLCRYWLHCADPDALRARLAGNVSNIAFISVHCFQHRHRAFDTFVRLGDRQ